MNFVFVLVFIFLWSENLKDESDEVSNGSGFEMFLSLDLNTYFKLM